jgi:hypothetical protein
MIGLRKNRKQRKLVAVDTVENEGYEAYKQNTNEVLPTSAYLRNYFEQPKSIYISYTFQK